MTVSEFQPEFRPDTAVTGPATSDSPGTLPGIPTGIPEGRAGVGTARAGVIAGAVVSILANVGHSLIRPDDAGPDWHPQLGAAFGAVWWPISLYVALEVLVSPLWPRGGWWWALRSLLTVPVAAVAAVVSYHHLSGLLAFWDEDPFTVRFGPIAVDGLMALCSLLLVRARHAGEPSVSTVSPSGEHGVSPTVSTEVSPVSTLTGRPSEHPGEHGPEGSPDAHGHEHASAHEPNGEHGPRAHGGLTVVGSRGLTKRAQPAAMGGFVQCDCGQSECAGQVGKSTRTRHRRQVRESTGD